MKTKFLNWIIGNNKLMIISVLLIMSNLFTSCSKHIYPKSYDTLKKADKVLNKTLKACSMRWGAEVSTKLVAKYEDLKKGGEVDWKAGMEAGGTLLDNFKNDSIGLQVYGMYLACIKPAVDNLISTTSVISADRPPTVVLIGSKEDYTNYKMRNLEQTSVELLQKRLGNFKVIPFTVSYLWDDIESIRAIQPDVIVIHASAFHDNQYPNQAVDKFQAFIKSLYGFTKTKFLVFSRVPSENPSPDLCNRWKRQVEFLCDVKLRDRLIFYPLTLEESNFTGKAGIEITQIVRCLSGLEATGYSSVYLSEIEKEAQQLIVNSSCFSAIH